MKIMANKLWISALAGKERIEFYNRWILKLIDEDQFKHSFKKWIKGFEDRYCPLTLRYMQALWDKRRSGAPYKFNMEDSVIKLRLKIKSEDPVKYAGCDLVTCDWDLSLDANIIKGMKFARKDLKDYFELKL